MYTFELTEKFIPLKERAIFRDFLQFCGIDEGVWKIFECLFDSKTEGTIPLLLRVYENSDLAGAAIILRCSKYGSSLYDNKMMADFCDLLRIPFYLWIKFGCCMDMMSNPGFVRDHSQSHLVYSAIADYLGKHSWMTMINDYTTNSVLYPNALTLPALPHALIDTSTMTEIGDYIKLHKNIRRKYQIFNKNGGTFDCKQNVLDPQDIETVRKCFISTAEKSVFYLPYEDLYLNSALLTSSTPINNVIYFIARLNGEFIGYQAALRTGNCLNALHGAFDRNRPTTYHAYDLLFVEMTHYAIAHNLKLIDVGAVLNTTKQRMVTCTHPMSYFMLSKKPIIRWIFFMITKLSKIQGQEQMRFYEEDKAEGGN
jgi:Acetyltransferase (GNAT) domain